MKLKSLQFICLRYLMCFKKSRLRFLKHGINEETSTSTFWLLFGKFLNYNIRNRRAFQNEYSP